MCIKFYFNIIIFFSAARLTLCGSTPETENINSPFYVISQSQMTSSLSDIFSKQLTRRTYLSRAESIITSVTNS